MREYVVFRVGRFGCRSDELLSRVVAARCPRCHEMPSLCFCHLPTGRKVKVVTRPVRTMPDHTVYDDCQNLAEAPSQGLLAELFASQRARFGRDGTVILRSYTL